MRESDEAAIAGNPGVFLYWIPLGAGGRGFVRLNGRIYETLEARVEGRHPLALYHTALIVRTESEEFTVESAWPSPDTDTGARGVVVEGPVFSRRLVRYRPFRYEVRCWRDGMIPDLAEAVESPAAVGEGAAEAGRVIALAPEVPPLVWGRDEMGTGEMWNSNSVISWLLTRAGMDVKSIRPPVGGRAPGWAAGVVVANTGRPAAGA